MAEKVDKKSLKKKGKNNAQNKSPSAEGENKSQAETSAEPEYVPKVTNISEEEEHERIKVLGAYDAQKAFLAMFQVLERQHDKGPVLNRKRFQLPPDDSLTVYKVENLEKQIMTVEKRLKFVSRRLNESKKEKMEMNKRIEDLEQMLMDKAKQDTMDLFATGNPTEKDLERLKCLQSRLQEKAKHQKEIKELSKKQDALDKVLKNAEYIITDSSVIKKPRHVVIVDPSFVSDKENKKAELMRIAQLQREEQENAKYALQHPPNVTAVDSEDNVLGEDNVASGQPSDVPYEQGESSKQDGQIEGENQDGQIEGENQDGDPDNSEPQEPDGEMKRKVKDSIDVILKKESYEDLRKKLSSDKADEEEKEAEAKIEDKQRSLEATAEMEKSQKKPVVGTEI